jgi:WD40 repeat protein
MAPDNQRFLAWDWSPDGKRLIGSLSGPPLVIGCFSFETNQYEKLTDFGGFAMWLPDSTRFIFLLNNKLYIGDVKTKRVREVFSTGENEIRSVDVSPDGELLLLLNLLIRKRHLVVGSGVSHKKAQKAQN